MPRQINTTIKPVTSNHGKSHHGNGSLKFVAVDGEGMTLANGDHVYVMLSVGQDTITNPKGLSFVEILDFLYEHYQPRTAYIGFYLGYDFTQWFKKLPEERAWMLLTREGQAKRKPTRSQMVVPFPVEYERWHFDLLNHKRLRIRPKLCTCHIVHCKCKKAAWMYICDAGGYFQTSFLRAIDPRKWPDPILTPKEYQIIEEGKELRSTATLGPDMARYNRLENDVLERVIKKFDEGLRKLGIELPPSKWFGPGQAAQSWLRSCAPTRIEISKVVPLWFMVAAIASYFGGWFEIICHGLIPGISWEYDINSAYPFIISKLPCLLHGKWSHGRGEYPPRPGAFVLVRASVEGYRTSPIGTMLHRNNKGRICRPINTSGWYWKHELEAAKKAGLIKTCNIFEWRMYQPCDCPPPIRRIANLYQMRLQIGKDSILGKACKLIYNSCYGKFAQSIGQPVFANAIYASLITAGCRTQILEAIATHPQGKNAVLMIATDAIYFKTPHPTLPISDKLGEWDCTKKTNLTLFKPGVYWDDNARNLVAEGKDPLFKSRGVNAKDLGHKIADLDSQFASWAGKKPPAMTVTGHEDHPIAGWPEIQFLPAFQMVTALQALMRHDWSQAGHVTGDETAEPLTQSANPFQKRERAYWSRTEGICRSYPRAYGDESYVVESEPYDKRFGQEDPDNPYTQESRQRYGITPDGYVIDEIFDAVRSEV